MSQTLCDKLDTLSEMGFLPKEIPVFVSSNLKASFLIRPYQIEGFSRFSYYFEQYPQKTKPVHLLYNMATGSGKTYMMAGSILYLYQKGYRKFLFFVNSKNIIAKTRENFLDTQSNKYLFSDKIIFWGKQVNIREVENFSSNDGEDIEIKFTTIHGLHTDMNETREWRLSYEEFEDKKIVMISDEAHHINALTKKKLGKTEEEEKKSWEYTVMKVLRMNADNVLLEYTATMDKGGTIDEKYLDKLIYKYDLKKFRADGWSKELDILKSDLSQEDRVLQALVLSQYRLKIAEKYKIRCKPVILFKAQKEIEESKQNEENFHHLIGSLHIERLENLRDHTDIGIVKTAFLFFEKEIGLDGLLRELKEDFKKENCLNVNEESLDKKSVNKKAQGEILSQAGILNTLEDKNNPIRAIFAVQKLNEWWDVLNLFDIVRMYDTRDGDEKNGVYSPGQGTISEAQLIWRGARYYPFSYGSYLWSDKYKRKFDKQEHELKVLETFYYHTFFNSRYISEIKQALRDIGMIDDNTKDFHLTLKEGFKQTTTYNEGLIFTNEKREKPTIWNDRLEKIGIRTRIVDYNIATGRGGDDIVFEEVEKNQPQDIGTSLREVIFKVSEIDSRIVRKALARNSFYAFENLKSHLGMLTGIEEFISSEKYLWSIEIKYLSSEENIKALHDWGLIEGVLAWVSKLLRTLEGEISNREREYEWTKEFKGINISKVFENKVIRVPESEVGITINQEWFAFESIVSTGEEESLIKCIEGVIESIKTKYEDIYLLRSERHFAIYNFDDGERFEPDFVLFMKEKKSHTPLTYQVFIEPKGKHLMLLDKWKEDFLNRIEWEAQILEMNFKNYKLVWLPFYNRETEQEFTQDLKTKFL